MGMEEKGVWRSRNYLEALTRMQEQGKMGINPKVWANDKEEDETGAKVLCMRLART